MFAYLNQIDGRGDDDFVAPPVPSGLTTTAGNGSVTVDWQNSSAADILEYNVSRRILNTTTITNIANGVPLSIYLDNTAVNGTTYQYRLTAVDVNDNESAFSGWVTGGPATVANTAIEDWRSVHFGSTANSGDGADTFDFDNDGLVNLLEYAFGLNPTSVSSIQIPIAQIVGGNCTISFPEPGGIDGITYGAEWNETLLPEGWAPIPDTGTGGQHTFSVSMGSKPRVFIRLKVTTQ